MEINNQIFVFSNQTFTRLVSHVDNHTNTLRFEIDPVCLFEPISARWNNLTKIDSGFYDRKLKVMIFLSDNRLYCFDQMGRTAKFSVDLAQVHPRAYNCTFIMLFHAFPTDWMLIGCGDVDLKYFHIKVGTNGISRVRQLEIVEVSSMRAALGQGCEKIEIKG